MCMCRAELAAWVTRVAACEAVPLLAATGAIATAADATTYIQDLTGFLNTPTSLWMKGPRGASANPLHHLPPLGTLPRMTPRFARVHRPIAPRRLADPAVFVNRA